MCVNFVVPPPFMYEYLVKCFHYIGIVLNAPIICTVDIPVWLLVCSTLVCYW